MKLSEIEGYLDDAMFGFFDVMEYPQFLHETLALFNKRMRRLPGRLERIKETLKPVLEEYRQSDKKRIDGIQWASDYASDGEQRSIEYQALTHIITYYFNSIFIMPTVIPTHICLCYSFVKNLTNSFYQIVILFYDLLSHPDCIDPLRKEIREVFGEDMPADFTPNKLDKLLKLDSFLKESQRIATPTLCNILSGCHIYRSKTNLIPSN